MYKESKVQRSYFGRINLLIYFSNLSVVYHLELTLLQKFLTSQDSSVTLQKAQWRCRALEKVSDAMIRRKTAKALIPDKMSSEEKEHGNGKQNFEQKIPSF